MDELIEYQSPHEVEVILGNGERFLFPVPSYANGDSKLLSLWLYGKSERTVIAYTRDILLFYQEIGKSLFQTTLEDIQHFDALLIQTHHLEPSSRARTLAALKSVMTFGTKMNILLTNVGAMFKLPKVEDTLTQRIMSEQSVKDLIDRESNPRNHAVLVLLYYGGLRVSELCNLTWRNLQQRDNSGQISVFGKGKKTRHILLDAETWAEVWALRGKASLDAYVFPSRQNTERRNEQGEMIRDNRLDESRIHQIVRNAADKVGVSIGEVSPHWLRHAHATYAIEHGAPLTLVRDTLGHKSIETTARYTHVRPNATSSTYLRKKPEERGK